jgi:parallel beta-helix repeat protein
VKASKIIFLVLLITLSSCLVNIATVQPQSAGTIYIRADGSVEGTDKIQRDGDVYTFTANIFNSIVVEKDNIVVNGGGCKLEGTGTESGIDISGRKNVVVENVEISQFATGINISYHDGGYNTISANSVANCGNGIHLEGSHNNTIIGNSLNNNDCGVFITASHFNAFKNNQLFDNQRNLVVLGGYLAAFTQYMDTSNTVNSKPVYYWVNEQDKIVPSDAGYVALTECKNISVQNLKLTGNGQGILLFSTKDSTITRNMVTDNDAGIFLKDSLKNTISENVIVNNSVGIRIYGMFPVYSQNNMICGNNITNNDVGIYIWDSSNNTLCRNNIADNGCGIHIIGLGGEAADNLIHQNNFINNTADVPGYWHTIVFKDVWVPPQSNVWDESKEGNYWSDYKIRCPNATEKESFGIWDTPYVISENNQDNYPLIEPVIIPSIVINSSDTTPSTEPPPDQQTGFLGTGLPMEYGYVMGIVIIAVIAATFFLIYFRKVKKTPGEVEKIMPEAET